MTATRRLNVWRGVVATTLVADLAVAVADRRTVALAGTLVASASLLMMWLLLLTTPPDAIRLPRGRSERIIGGAAIVLYALAATVGPPANLLVLSIAFAATILGLIATRRLDVSAWWIALVAWHPLVIGISRS